jgi:hypothetical protein
MKIERSRNRDRTVYPWCCDAAVSLPTPKSHLAPQRDSHRSPLGFVRMR